MRQGSPQVRRTSPGSGVKICGVTNSWAAGCRRCLGQWGWPAEAAASPPQTASQGKELAVCCRTCCSCSDRWSYHPGQFHRLFGRHGWHCQTACRGMHEAGIGGRALCMMTWGPRCTDARPQATDHRELALWALAGVATRLGPPIRRVWTMQRGIAHRPSHALDFMCGLGRLFSEAVGWCGWSIRVWDIKIDMYMGLRSRALKADISEQHCQRRMSYSGLLAQGFGSRLRA